MSELSEAIYAADSIGETAADRRADHAQRCALIALDYCETVDHGAAVAVAAARAAWEVQSGAPEWRGVAQSVAMARSAVKSLGLRLRGESESDAMLAASAIARALALTTDRHDAAAIRCGRLVAEADYEAEAERYEQCAQCDDWRNASSLCPIFGLCEDCEESNAADAVTFEALPEPEPTAVVRVAAQPQPERYTDRVAEAVERYDDERYGFDSGDAFALHAAAIASKWLRTQPTAVAALTRGIAAAAAAAALAQYPNRFADLTAAARRAHGDAYAAVQCIGSEDGLGVATFGGSTEAVADCALAAGHLAYFAARHGDADAEPTTFAERSAYFGD